MTDLLLFLILVAQIALIFAVNGLRKQVEKVNDFSKEDSKLEKATEDAKAELEKISQKN